MRAAGMGYGFTNYIYALTTMFPMVKKSELRPESEITIRSENSISKWGLPQGWSISPLMANIVINYAFKLVKFKPIMYADDGLVMTAQPFEIDEED
jgi:hypothetical protein